MGRPLHSLLMDKSSLLMNKSSLFLRKIVKLFTAELLSRFIHVFEKLYVVHSF